MFFHLSRLALLKWNSLHITFVRGMIIYIYKEDCLSLPVAVAVSVCLNAFAQFSRYTRAEILQVGRGRHWTGRGGVKTVGVLMWGAGRDRSWMGYNCGGAPAGIRGIVGKGGGETGKGRGWAVVKARATPGNPACNLILMRLRLKSWGLKTLHVDHQSF